MTRTNISLQLVLALMTFLFAASVVGCETTPRTNDHRGGLGAASGDRSGMGSGERAPSARELEEQFVKGLSQRPTMSSHVRVAVRPIGAINYDDMVLPLVSPDGRFLAVQSGVSPTWPTLLAESDADPPTATRVDIYHINNRQKSLDPVASVDYPVLLGRSSDREGFLVEAPQDDGSRWIGKVEWETGAVHWLVADEHVNAFPALGVGGRLAWSRRQVDGPDDSFELVVRYGMDEHVISDGQRSWLMPTWSIRRENSLYVLALDEWGDLDLIFANVMSDAAFRQSQRRLRLAHNADVYSAYQSIGAQTCGPDRAQMRQEQSLFYHPSRMRMAVWRPLTSSSMNQVLFDQRSFAAVVEPDGFALVSVDSGLLLQGLERPERTRQEVLEGLQVPRAVASQEWPYVMLVPDEGQIGVVLLSLMPGNE